MGAEGAVNILYRKSAPEEKAEIIKEYEDKFSNPYRAAERGLIDEVIMPRDTRYKLIQLWKCVTIKTKAIRLRNMAICLYDKIKIPSQIAQIDIGPI